MCQNDLCFYYSASHSVRVITDGEDLETVMLSSTDKDFYLSSGTYNIFHKYSFLMYYYSLIF